MRAEAMRLEHGRPRRPAPAHPYFLVTFTVPEPWRAWLRFPSVRRPGPALRHLGSSPPGTGRHPQRWGASLGMLGVVHTWSRTLIYHPHVHYLVPAAWPTPLRRGEGPSVFVEVTPPPVGCPPARSAAPPTGPAHDARGGYC